jgi:ketosteroid isomerase-like protein
VTNAEVQAWLDRYVAAWSSYDSSEIGDLFSDEASYRYHAGDDPIVGRAAIVADWLNPGGDPSERDMPGSWRARYEPYLVGLDRAVVYGRTDYEPSADGPARIYDNCWLLEFDPDGRCRSFVEYYNRRPDGA